MAAASYSNPASLAHRAVPYPATVANNVPPGTFAPGTKVQVGSQRVVIEKYLSEGGFAHVYVVRVPTKDNSGHSIAVLKRVAVPDKDALANMRTEVETMKRLQGHKHIVRYFDSHASQLKGGGYEVFLLMEYCDGGGLIDFMNTRLQHRLTEPEILTIFAHVSEGVATMHYLKPPLLHRDLKVENVLISKSTSGIVTYKLCDFGSAAQPRPAATTATEGRLIEDDIQKHTTMQYRSPEMVDVWRRLPIDEKSDIWALGVFLYKLCYYTTPFEHVGQMAILNASYKYPSYPAFSDRLKRFIAWMLKEDPAQRPNIYQVVKEVCSMRATPVPIKDIYHDRTQSETRRTQQLPSTTPVATPPPAGISHAPTTDKRQVLPDIAPMRRGRPSAPSQPPRAANSTTSPPPPPAADPFAALDSKDYNVRVGAVDELANRFPSIDDFSIALDKGAGFQFPSALSQTAREPTTTKVNDKVTNALADQVFATTSPASSAPLTSVQTAPHPTRSTSLRKPAVPATNRVSTSKRQSANQQPNPVRAGYTSTGTMTTPVTAVPQVTSPPPVQSPPSPLRLPDVSKRPIWRVPEHDRSSSQPRSLPATHAAADARQARPSMLDVHRSKSQTATVTLASPASSRPSLEGHRLSQLYTGESISRARSANSARPRPVSAAYVESNLDYLRDQERESAEKKRPSLDMRRSSRSIQGYQPNDTPVDDNNIQSDRDYLRSLESDPSKGEQRVSHDNLTGHKKRASLPSLMGKFGDKFKRFERTKSSDGRLDEERATSPQRMRTPSPRPRGQDDPYSLSPIFGSEATVSPSRYVDEVAIEAETEDLPPAMRREFERRRLSAEERRVAEAAEQDRNREKTGGPPPPPSNRASTIQQRVQAFLDEGNQPVKPKRTAEGYGRYTEDGQAKSPQKAAPAVRKGPPPNVARKPLVPVGQPEGDLTYNKVRTGQQTGSVPSPSPMAAQVTARTAARPSAPPKPKALTTGTGSSYSARPSSSSSSSSAQTQAQPQSYQSTGRGPSLAALLARDNEGVAEAGPSVKQPSPVAEQPSELNNPYIGQVNEWEADFSKRYPSLSGIEMVETEISAGEAPQKRGIRIREV